MVEFDWDENNIEHIARHNVLPEEVEDAFSDSRRIGTTRRRSSQEKRWAMIASTQYGRVLFIVFTRREEMIRVVTARDATDKEKRTYRR